VLDISHANTCIFKQQTSFRRLDFHIQDNKKVPTLINFSTHVKLGTYCSNKIYNANIHSTLTVFKTQKNI